MLNLLKRIISKVVHLFDAMTMRPRRAPVRKERVLVSPRRDDGELVHITGVNVQLPGNRKRFITVGNDENISSLRKRVAASLGVKETNWGIYIPNNNRLKIVEDTKKINQVDRNKLHFYPKAVIR